MSRVVAICNQKGGVGKTTTAINLSAYLARLGKRVLLIDLDPQANATSGLGIEKESVTNNIYHALLNTHSLDSIVLPTEVENLFLAPSHFDLSGADIELIEMNRREYRLREEVSKSLGNYDLVIIDCPPSLSLLTINALVACDGVLIPLQCEYYSLEGLSQLFKTIQIVKKRYELLIEIEGIVLTMADSRTSLSEHVVRDARNFLGEKVFRRVIPRNVRLSEAPSFGKPILLYDPRSRGALAYRELAEEFINRLSKISEIESSRTVS